MFKRKKIIKNFAWLLMVVVAASCVPKQDKQNIETNLPEETNRSYAYGICVDSLALNHYKIERGSYLSSILMDLGFTGGDVQQIIDTISPLYPPSKLQIGSTYATITTPDTTSTIQYLVFEKSKTDYVVVDFCNNSLKVHQSTKPVTIQRRYAEGTITSSLWNAIIESGSSPMLALKMSDLYAWQVDFFDTKQGDSFRLIYDEAWIDDTTFLDIASIEGAVFNHQGRKFIAVPFEQDSTREYFDEEGNSLRKQFLKAPLDFFRISSRFSNARYHPVLKTYRPHHGVDYAAPTGTPVKTVGDGVVITKGYQRGGGGNYLKVKHNSVYTTTYMHLSRFAKGIQKGSSVKQGEVIGYVGATGLATGPHLDYRVHKNNQPINPLTMEAPPSYPVKPELLDSFLVIRDNMMMHLDSMHYVLKKTATPDSLSLNKDVYTQSL
ncbi:MAG: peptidoglycan DD-metalloendopeptidase family protein [Dysgonamonadaceae bacterium]|nr:peptidoglycan DD-metalloendopeptidase family protein [Dysgonamonadaceae bacterium]MDD4728196.1 peptidoglycan DD-metalloendopeptidase family protein [Dysgonamonadaceae bacterium]